MKVTIPERKSATAQKPVSVALAPSSKVLAIDDVAFMGNGFYAVRSQADYQSIISQFPG